VCFPKSLLAEVGQAFVVYAWFDLASAGASSAPDEECAERDGKHDYQTQDRQDMNKFFHN
jgi:hypothetical protein